jgi:hypothetical protein
MADLSILKDSGMDIDSLSADEQAALGNLDAAELQSLASIRAKLNGEDEVGGFASSARHLADGNLVW